MQIISHHKHAKLALPIFLAAPQTDDEWNAYYHLRWSVLRNPWHQPPNSEKDQDEESSQHFCLIYDAVIIAVCRLQFNSPRQAQVRFMAIDEAFRGFGLGNILMHHVDQICKQNNMQRIFLQARENAVNFYKRNGYVILEKTFLLFDEIQHYSMEKLLAE
jgi:predicted GNAT family N-acyltransferase